MSYNLLSNGTIKTNLDIGTVELDHIEIRSLIDLESDDSVHLYNDDVFCIECDLVDRLAMDKVKYYFNAEIDGVSYSGTLSTVASGISFEYKNNRFEEYEKLPTYFEDNYYFTKTDEDVFAPRMIRITHDLTTSGVSISGSAYGVYAHTSLLEFGEEGELQEDSVTSLLGEPEVYKVPVYNNNEQRALGFAQLKPEHIYLDDYLYIGTSSDGPWNSIKDDSNVIFNNKLSYLVDLEKNTFVKDGSIRITGEKVDENDDLWAYKNYGIFKTSIFKVSDLYYTNLEFLNTRSESLYTRIMVDPEDLNFTVEIKSSKNLEPYYAYRIIKRHLDPHYAHLMEDISIDTNTLLNLYEDSPLLTYSDYKASSRARDVYDYYIKFDDLTGKSFIFYNAYSSYRGTKVSAYIINKQNEINESVDLLDINDSMQIKFYKLEFESDGGFWVYFHADDSNSDDIIMDIGYYLIHFDKELDITFKYFSSEKNIYDISVDYTSGDLWYTLRNEASLKKIDKEGNTLVSFKDTDDEEHDLELTDLKGCAHTSEGSCWYINGKYLYKVDGNGNLLNNFNFENKINSNELKAVHIYNDNTLIVRKGDDVSKVKVLDKERFEIKYTVSSLNIEIITIKDNGFWIYCRDGSSYFVEIGSGDIIYEIDETLDSDIQQIPGYMMFELENASFKNAYFPTESDSYWEDVDFSKVDLRSYYLPKDTYYQARVTLRLGKPSTVYDVPKSIDDWLIKDTFNNEDGYNKPYEHRWRHHEDVYIDYLETTISNTISGSDIEFSDDVCVFPGDSEVEYIDSKDRWFIKDIWDQGEYDIEFEYIIPDDNVDDFTINLKVSPIDDYDHSFENFYIKREGDSYYAGYKLHGDDEDPNWHTHDDETEITNIFTSYGKMRMKHEGEDVYMYLYNIYNEEWEEIFNYNRDSIAGSHDHINFGGYENFYTRIDYQGTGFMYINYFSGNDDCIYWFHANTPIISKLYLTDAIEIGTVYPGNYKDVYIKIDADKNALYEREDINTYELRAWWELY